MRSITFVAHTSISPLGEQHVSRSMPPSENPFPRSPNSIPMPPPCPLTIFRARVSAADRVLQVRGSSAFASKAPCGQYGIFVIFPPRGSLRQAIHRGSRSNGANALMTVTPQRRCRHDLLYGWRPSGLRDLGPIVFLRTFGTVYYSHDSYI